MQKIRHNTGNEIIEISTFYEIIGPFYKKARLVEKMSCGATISELIIYNIYMSND